jgi:hypothetical protein
MLRDHKVPFRREESLAESALACRRFASNENLARFNVVDFVERVLPSILATRKKGPLKISFFDAAEGDIPAFVTFNPLTLHVDGKFGNSPNLATLTRDSSSPTSWGIYFFTIITPKPFPMTPATRLSSSKTKNEQNGRQILLHHIF